MEADSCYKKQKGGMERQDTTDSGKFGAEASNQVAEKIDSSEDVGFRDSAVGLSFSSVSLLLPQLRSTGFICLTERISMV